jgi:hypothetical protein
MVDELQVHDLTDEEKKRVVIARSLGFTAVDSSATLEKFDEYLLSQRNIAKACFDRILLKGQEI